MARLQASAADPAPRPTLPYLPGLDGLRALAVIAVILYHADLGWLPGGFLGVEVFFVISGYIITAGLVAEWRQRGRIDVGRFWLRRARRLLPALFFLLLGTMAFTAAFLPAEFHRVQSDATYSFAYVTNWRLIFAHTSYFETFGRPPLLRHLWSLAVEEQFYVAWPVILAVVLKLLRPRAASALVLAGAAASAVAMALLFNEGHDTSRIYYGTDTRACGLLMGAAFALAFRTDAAPLGPRLKVALNGLGLAALAGLAIVFLRMTEFAPILYQGGFALVGGLSVCLIAAVVHGGRFGDRLYGFGVLRWIGVRSYSIYLWHWPVFAVTRPNFDVSIDGWALLAVRLVIVMGLAQLSYAAIEQPVRQRGWAFFMGASRRVGSARRATAYVLGATALVTICVSAAASQAPSARASHSADLLPPAITDETVAALNTITLPETFYAYAGEYDYGFEPAPLEAPPETTIPEPEPEPVLEAAIAAALPAPPPPRVVSIGQGLLPAGVHVTAIGDSVLLGAAAQLRYTLGNVDVDAEVGRPVWTAVNILYAKRAAGELNDVVLIHVGNNGTFLRKELDQILDATASARLVVIVNLDLPRAWEDPNNNVIAAAAGQPNVVVVDWRAAAGENFGLFAADHVHLSGEGARLYSNLVATAILNNLH